MAEFEENAYSLAHDKTNRFQLVNFFFYLKQFLRNLYEKLTLLSVWKEM